LQRWLSIYPVKNSADGPIGVKGRNSDNRLIREKLNWAPSQPLRKGMELTYAWINEMVKKSATVK